MVQQRSDSRLKVTVRIQENLQTARIEVRGSVTRENLRALYVVARRTSVMLPGREIILDLTHARAAVEAILELHDPDRLLRVIGADDNKEPCRIRVLDPTTGQDTKETA
ncbi:hypothetical protein [Arthrobacter rhizosphaerae]|uniref:hypothetical protein n=1 Tax=Arthrobacter rhizosphaerae TaxID=2855490 RepID=UPI001FF448F8|nr:hypothetical protein [Arthrobacter rhizosphaerae]